MTRFASPEALLDAVGTDLGTSAWVEIDQRRIDLFADATDDHQWIHIDPERAAAGPFGAPIAHGYLSLSLLAPFLFELLQVDGTGLVINAGSDRVRFLSPVRVGSRIRAAATISGAERIPSGVRVRTAVTVEIEGTERPALVAETLMVFAPA
ncbi:MaoC family dehydratase [Amnibacterium sp. CER49]|uniref:MaoC family dehydratase n=1 Tax=Amnibacterium sp. CER49 TaxID=3039161 RepID=UPI00244BCFE5|nr:MaoC family dehydratase [Amnibacterium sp. CER49]MDH2444923.1 MaoC family dehydratase [Amnibacterium sp. CER49]